ncbi:hypothetical protein D3C71_2109840 [compost metagenome]
MPGIPFGPFVNVSQFNSTICVIIPKANVAIAKKWPFIRTRGSETAKPISAVITMAATNPTKNPLPAFTVIIPDV